MLKETICVKIGLVKCQFTTMVSRIDRINSLPPIPKFKGEKRKECDLLEVVHMIDAAGRGYSSRQIETIVGRDHTTISRKLKRYYEDDAITPEHRPGRPTILTEGDKRQIVRWATKKPYPSIRELEAQIRKYTEEPVSTTTIFNLLNNEGILNYQVRSVTAITEDARKERLTFCNEHKNWSAIDWRRVIFSDEKYVLGTRHIFNKVVRFRPNTDICEINAKRSKGSKGKWGTKIMVWSCISYYGTGYMVSLPEGEDAETYRNIIDGDLMETIEFYKPALQHDYGKGTKFVFQQDNPKVHTGELIQSCFEEHAEDFDVITWPRYSADLSPIENFWAILDYELQLSTSNLNASELFVKIAEVWYSARFQELCKVLIDSMPNRIARCIAAKGNYITGVMKTIKA